MIGKLRRKFIFLNMLFVVTILAVIYIVIAFSYYHQSKFDNSVFMRNELEKVMKDSGGDENMIDGPVHNATADDPPDREPHPENNTNRGMFAFLFQGTNDAGKRGGFLPSVIYRVSADGSTELLQNRDLTIAEDITQELISTAISSSDPDENGFCQGYFTDYELRYLVKTDANGDRYLIFADISYSQAMFRRFMLQCAAVFIGSCFLFFLLSWFLSRVALAPTERAWEQQNRFVADASHELKTPITVILANLGIITSHPESTVREQSKWIRNTQEEAERMQQLIQDLLFLAKCDANAFQSVFSEVDFSDCAMNRILNFESVAFEQNVTLDSNIAPDLKILGNEGQIKQLISILLDNAVKYAGANGKVFLEAKKEGSRVVLSVRNTGEPIDPAEIPHIFERFYRTDKSRSRTEGGYGLGLSIAENIVKLHNGTIRCESSAKTGTLFTVELPTTQKKSVRTDMLSL